ncbi:MULTISPECIES: hypothetical protein [Anaeromyxobacter]|uniref:hypothetical protein n=1 Tax=Anaeromyxobacter TaxID=161492 RepID=UPI001F58F0BF|nr:MULTISPECIES: hypothetical protein [unclassified Anaeromyxobacter]
MTALRVMAGFAAGATLAGMVVGVARLTETVEPATAVAEQPAATAPAATASAPSGPRPEEPPARWHAPEGAPEEVTAGVLAKVASQRAEAARGCRTSREPSATEKHGRKGARAEPKAARCPPEEGIESVEIDWNGPPATR